MHFAIEYVSALAEFGDGGGRHDQTGADEGIFKTRVASHSTPSGNLQAAIDCRFLEPANETANRDGDPQQRFANSRFPNSRCSVDEPAISEVMGEQEFAALVAAFYRRVKVDDLIGPMYPDDDWQGAEERLRDFLIFRFGGSDRYIQQRGHPRLRMRHAPFAIGPEQRDRWLHLMDESMVETEVPKSAAEPLRAFFTNVAEFMRNRDS